MQYEEQILSIREWEEKSKGKREKKVEMLLSNQKQSVCGIHIYHKNCAMLTLCPLIYKILYHFQAANIKPAVAFWSVTDDAQIPGPWNMRQS